MSHLLDLILEPTADEQQTLQVQRLAIRLAGRDLWLEADGSGGLNIFADSQDDEEQTPVLVLRPQALNALGLSIALETFADEAMRITCMTPIAVAATIIEYLARRHVAQRSRACLHLNVIGWRLAACWT